VDAMIPGTVVDNGDAPHLRCIVDLVRSDGGGIAGSLTWNGDGKALPFFGWLQLLSLLESPPASVVGDT